MTHANEDPYIFEYLVDLSQAKVTAEQPLKFVEAIYSADGNTITLGSQIIFDPSLELANSLNYKIQLDDSTTEGMNSSIKAEFGKTVFAVLKQLVVALPLRRPVIVFKNNNNQLGKDSFRQYYFKWFIEP